MNSAFIRYKELSRSRGCYPPRPSALVNNTLDPLNSSYPTQPHSLIANYFSMMRVTGTHPPHPPALPSCRDTNSNRALI